MDAAHWQQVIFSCKSKINSAPHASGYLASNHLREFWCCFFSILSLFIFLSVCLVLGACRALFDETMISPASFRSFLGPVLALYPSCSRSMHTIISIYLIHRLWGEAFVALILSCPSPLILESSTHTTTFLFLPF